MKSVDAPVYGYWAALYRSFYSTQLYLDVAKRWTGYGLRYFLLMMILWCIPMSGWMMLSFNRTYDAQVIDPLSMIPPVYIQNGIASFDKPMPYLVKNNKGQVIVIIDTTGEVNDFSDYPHLAILVNKTKMSVKVPMPKIPISDVLKEAGEQPLVETFDKQSSFILNGPDLIKLDLFASWRHMILLIIYPMALSLFFFLFLVLLLIMASLGKLIALTFFSQKLTFKQSCRLVFITSTPMMLLLLGLLLSNMTFQGYGFLLLAIFVPYYCFSVCVLKWNSKKMVRG